MDASLLPLLSYAGSNIFIIISFEKYVIDF